MKSGGKTTWAGYSPFPHPDLLCTFIHSVLAPGKLPSLACTPPHPPPRAPLASGFRLGLTSGGQQQEMGGRSKVGVDFPSLFSLPSCGLAGAASAALAGQPLPAGCSSGQGLHQLPSFTPSGPGPVTTSQAPSLWVLRHHHLPSPHPDLETIFSLHALQLPLCVCSLLPAKAGKQKHKH